MSIDRALGTEKVRGPPVEMQRFVDHPRRPFTVAGLNLNLVVEGTRPTVPPNHAGPETDLELISLVEGCLPGPPANPPPLRDACLAPLLSEDVCQAVPTGDAVQEPQRIKDVAL